MKINYLEIKNYKQFKDLTLDLTYPAGHKKAGEPLDKICIIGQSGTGKTNLLEIITKSTIDFSEHKSSYKPFSKFIGESTDDKYITTEFISKSNIKVKTLFTEIKSEINFEKNKTTLLEDIEKNYFIGTKDYSLLNNENTKDEEIQTYEMSMSDRALLNKLTTAKAELTVEHINLNPFGSFNYHSLLGGKSPSEKLADVNSAIRDLESKYYRKDNIDKSLQEIKKKNFIDRYIININDDVNNLWITMQKRIDNYQLLRGQFIDTLSNKLLEDDNYTKDDYKNEIAAWEDINENLLNKISLEINTVLNKFNLELTKIDENQTSYNSFTIKDLSNGNIIKYDDLSTGTKNLLSTFVPLKTYAPKDSIILIDEPEMSFYPDIQRQLTELYINMGENNQLIMATHSPLIASSFEPWEVVELKFDSNNQVDREQYYNGDNHIDNYILDPRSLTWTGILTNIFDLKEDSNFTFREKKLMEYASLKAEIKMIENNDEKEKKFKELMKLSKLLGLSN
jgi:ABC-type lipoprotein export system ATPase subunit